MKPAAKLLSQASVWCCIVLCWTGVVGGATGVVYQQPYAPSFHPLDVLDPSSYNPLRMASPAVLELKSSLFHPVEEIDFEKRQITFAREDNLGFRVWEYHYPELSDYLGRRMNFSFFDGWTRTMASKRSAGEQKKGLPSLEFALPVQWPTWAERILGKEPPKLTIDGFLRLTLGWGVTNNIDKDDRSVEPNIDQEYRFSVRGTVGRVIDINMNISDQGTDNDFENQLKNFKIEYKDDSEGLEDEIIQEVVAGYQSFSMPGTALSGYSEQKDGLFGVKIRSQLGPLSLTTIFSQENAESSEKIINPNSTQSTDASSGLGESDIDRYRYFWLDTLYLNAYRARIAGSGGQSSTLPKITELQVWVQQERSTDKDNDFIEKDITDKFGEKYNYRFLVNTIDYDFSDSLGWVRLNTRVGDAMRIGVYMRSSDGRVDKGDSLYTIDTKNTANLPPELKGMWLLKTDNPDPNNPTFPLAWRNTYQLVKGDGKNFNLEIKQNLPTTAGDSLIGPGNLKYRQILGLYSKEDEIFKTKRLPYVEDVAIFDFEHGVMTIPPFANALTGHQPFRNPALDGDSSDNVDATNAEIYTQAFSRFNDNGFPNDKYQFLSSGIVSQGEESGGQSGYRHSLGWNIIPGSERAVVGKSLVLERHVDYTIDYEMGTIELVSGRARAANEIVVTYQQESVFVPENKLFVGVRGEVKLPFISDNSLVGASFLYQNADAAELIPRLKQEPYSKMLLNVNTRMDFEPQWMTKVVDALPGVVTQTPSSVNFEFEMAHSRMNPNLRGKAYLDDFEASKLVLPLGENHASWFRGSPPVTILDDLLSNPPAWYDFWYTAQDASTDRSRIWVQDEQEDIQRASERFESVLRLVSQPAPDDDSLAKRYDTPWTAIMNPLPGSMADLTDYKYLELTVRRPRSGRLFVDMGVIAEDISVDGGLPNGVMNDEDTAGLAIYKQELDRGLDFRPDGDEYWLVPDSARTGWDTLSYGDPRLPRPTDPARDNWANYSNADNNSLAQREKVNGTQDNGDPPNSEDVNFDDALQTSLQERFFRFTIDFNDTAKMARYRNLTTTAQAANGWYHFIIPLSDSALVVKSALGREPELRDIRAVRLVWSDFVDNLRDSLDIARIQFVGNQWQEVPTIATSTDTVYKIDAQVVNSTDNPEYRAMRNGPNGYTLPFTSRQTEDGKAYRPEQALRMVFDSLNPGEVALAERRLVNNAIDVSMYEKMMLYVRSDKDYSRNDSALSFVLRFGTNSSCYYEYRTDRLHRPDAGQAALAYEHAGWDERNFVNIDLKELSDFKYEVLQLGEKDSVARHYSANPRYRIYSSTKALPSISRIEWMALGVVRDSSATASVPLSGEVWANELMAEGIRKLNGTAVRLSLNSKWADFLVLNTGMTYDDGDFRTMTNNAIGAGNSTLNGNVGVDLTLDRFLPQNWGVKVPLGAHVSGSLVRPQLVPDSDIPLSDANGQTDGFSQMVGDAFDRITNELYDVDDYMTESERYQSVVRSMSLNSSFSKSSRSKNPLLGLTADRLSLDARYSRNNTERNEGPNRDGSDDGLFQRTTKRDEYYGSVRYDLSPRNYPKWSSWRPFEGAKAPWLNRYKSYEFSLLPQNLNFDVVQIRHFTRQDSIEKSGQGVREQGFSLDHGYNFSYEPLKPVLNITYNLDIQRDLKNAINRKFKSGEGWGSFFRENVFELDSAWREYWLLKGEGGRSQKATLTFRPSFVNWLSHDFNYDVDYNSSGSPNLTDSLGTEISASQNANFSFNSSLEIADLFRDMASVSGKKASVVFTAFQKGFEKVGLRSIQFNYTAALSVRNEHLTPDFLDRADIKPINYFAYTLGVRGRSLMDIMTANVDDDASGDYSSGLTPAAMQFRKDNQDSRRYSDDSRTGTQTYSLSTSLTIPQPLDMRFNTLKLSWDTKGTIKPDTALWDSTWTWPDIRVNLSTGFLSKVGLINDFMQRVTLTSGYSFRKSETTSGLATMPPKLTIDNSWSPLVRLEGTTRKYPVNITYTFDRKNILSQSTYWGQNRTIGHNLSLTYSVPQATKPREFTLFRWTIPIQGKMDFRLTADFSKVLEFVERVAGENKEVEWGEADRTVVSRSLRPQFTYIFTDKVKAEVFYEGSLRSSEESDDIRTNRFAVIVEIQI
jgi:hypothetical protein